MRMRMLTVRPVRSPQTLRLSATLTSPGAPMELCQYGFIEQSPAPNGFTPILLVIDRLAIGLCFLGVS
jgi:hypothetical protein